MNLTELFLKLINARCPKCSYALNAQDLEKAATQLQAGVLVCPKCQCLVRAINGTFGSEANVPIDKSASISIEQIQFNYLPNDSLEFIVPWRMKSASVLLVFGLFWVGLIFCIGLMSLKHKATISGVHITDVTTLIFSIFPILTPGLLILIGWAIQFFNQRKISVSRNLISFSDGPLWTKKVNSVNPLELTNLSIRSRVGGKINRKPFYHFEINMHMKNGSIVKLCSARTIADAIFIEKKIESYLNIKDNKTLDQVRTS